jgi:hypothetical protein
MQLRPEERKTMLELGRFRIIRTDDLADAVYDGKPRKLREDLSYLRSKGWSPGISIFAAMGNAVTSTGSKSPR